MGPKWSYCSTIRPRFSLFYTVAVVKKVVDYRTELKGLVKLFCFFMSSKD